MIRPNPRKPSIVSHRTGDLSDALRPKFSSSHSSTPFLTNHPIEPARDVPRGLPFVPLTSNDSGSGESRFPVGAPPADNDSGNQWWKTAAQAKEFYPQEILTRVTSPLTTLYPSIGSPVNWKYTSATTHQFKGFVPIHGDDSRGGTPVFGPFKTPDRKASPALTLDTVSMSTSPDTLGSFDRCTTPSSLSSAVAASRASATPKTVRIMGHPYCRPASTIPRPKQSSLQAASSEFHPAARPVRPKSAPTIGGSRSSEEDASRKVKLKTELCMHYENGRACPFGDNCTYAHGEEELQMTKLVDLHDAGLVDMDTHRVKPCWTFTATGSCPFGRRCTNIHDPRCGNKDATSWLPHTETQGNTMETDINVESLYQKRQNAIIYNNPFGDQFQLTSSTFDDLYKLVNGMGQGANWCAAKYQQRKTVHSIYKLQIALKIRGKDSNWHYKYRPQHIVHDQLCMVLQKRAYRVQTNVHGSRTRITSAMATSISSVVEISMNMYNPRASNHILVHEIAFGPDSDPTVRGVALWFNINESDVVVCTQQQAKRFRWKKPGGNSKKRVEKPSIFDSGLIESFPMVRPHDAAAYHFVTEILKHRLASLKRELTVNLKERHDHLEKLENQRKYLKERFTNQRQSWMAWAWPTTLGRMLVDANTPAPRVDAPYAFDTSGSHAKRVWKSFVDYLGSDDGEDKGVSKSKADVQRPLKLFERLALGISVDDTCKGIPHIIAHRALPAVMNYQDQEKCWKALLQKSCKDDAWKIVREHFEKSRSRKVLSMVQ